MSSTAIRDGAEQKAARVMQPACWAIGTESKARLFAATSAGVIWVIPTANMSIEGLHPPKFGVYVVEVDILTGPFTRGATVALHPWARDPMFGENRPNLESFIFDFKGDIYGEQISVALIEYLRPEQVFDGVDALIAQMDDDCTRAREILARLEAAG